jgi:hypothetical protein
MPAEDVLDRAWARALFDQAVQRLQAELAQEGRQRDWDLFEFHMGGGGEPGATYKMTAQRFDLSEWNVWKRLTRITDRLKDLMRQEIAATVEKTDDMEDELRTIMNLLQ